MPALKTAARNAFSIVKQSNPFPAFSGVTGQIDHVHTGKVEGAGALRVAAIWIAVTVLADEIASLTMRLVEKDDKTRQPVQPRALRALWGKPNPDQTRFGIEATQTLSQMLWGVSYDMLGWVRSGDLDVRWPLNPGGVKLERFDDGLKLTLQGQGELFNRKDERPEFSFNPLYTLPGSIDPVSPVAMACELAGLSLEYQKMATRLAGRSFNPAAILTSNESIPEPEAKEMSERMSRLWGGADNAGKFAIIGGPQLKLEKVSMSMVDAQMIEQYDRVFYTLMAIFRVPPTVAGMVEKLSTWGTGVAEFSRGLERFTLRPLVIRRQEAHQDYITKWVNPDLQVKYIFDSLLSAAPKDRAAIQRERLLMGATSVERVLAQEDDPPFGEDETVFSQLSLATDEERRLSLMAKQAEAYGALIRAGVEPDAAAAETGFDPKKLTHTGLPPVTVQSEGGEA